MLMDAAINRRSMLALSAAGALATALPSCIVINKHAQSEQESEDDPPDLSTYGYDANAGEGHSEAPKAHNGALPAKASVKTEWLPPVGNQGGVGDCFIWAAIYGCAGFYAASKKQKPPTSAEAQAGAVYAFIHYQAANKVDDNKCDKGGQVGKALDWLRANGGTPSLAAAPNGKQNSKASCQSDWSQYQSKTIPPDSSFLIPAYKVVQINGPDGLKNLRTVIASGVPIAFGTHLLKDFHPYNGTPRPTSTPHRRHPAPLAARCVDTEGTLAAPWGTAF